MYKEAILEQVKGFKVRPGGKVAKYEVNDGFVEIQQTLWVNLSTGNGPFYEQMVRTFVSALENGLS